MKVYKIAFFYNDEFIKNVRLSFVPHGTFKGFRLKDGELVAVFGMRIEQGYECYNFVGELELKLNESFEWPDEYMESDGPTDWYAVTRGTYRIQLVRVEAEEEPTEEVLSIFDEYDQVQSWFDSSKVKDSFHYKD